MNEPVQDITSLTPILPHHIDATMRSCFRTCQQKFFTEFCCGLRPASVSIHLHAGACIATAIETMYRATFQEGRNFQESLEIAHAVFMIEWGDVVPVDPRITKTRERCWEGVEEYFREWPPLTDNVRPYKLESRPTMEFGFAIPLTDEGFPRHPETGDPFHYSGRFDMLGDMNGIPVVKDEKTTTSIGANWSSQWDLRGQFIGYVWACQQSGINVDTTIVRGIGILKTKISLAHTEKVYPRFLVDRWYTQLRRDVHAIVKCWNEKYFDYDFAEACSMYGGCQFKDLCHSPHPERWYKDYTITRWNPLQKNPIALPKVA